MHPTRRHRLEEVMAGLAAGDDAFCWALVTEFGDELAAAVRRVLADMGRRDVLSERGRVEGMAIDIALHLRDHGARWNPTGGALPWVWAERAVRAIVARDVGHRSVPLDDRDAGGGGGASGGKAGHPPGLPARTAAGRPGDAGVDGGGRAGAAAPTGGAPGGEPSLELLGSREPAVALLVEAMDLVGSERDRAVHVEYRVQKAAGDPSPSRTVSAAFGLRPDNVRQIDARMRRKLRALAATDARFRDLEALRWLA
jgi:hypothetical protein